MKIDLEGTDSTVDYSYGGDGLGGWADIPANMHLLTKGNHGVVVPDHLVAQIRAAVGWKFDDYMQGKPVPAAVIALIERLVAQYGG